MYEAEYDAFQDAFRVLCASMDRGYSDHRCKGFWIVLQPYSILDVKARIRFWIAHRSEMPRPVDLIPPRALPVSTMPPDVHECPIKLAADRAMLRTILKWVPPQTQLPAMIARKNQIIAEYRTVAGPGDAEIDVRDVWLTAIRALEQLLRTAGLRPHSHREEALCDTWNNPGVADK